MKHEKAVKVIIDNFIELSEQDFKDFQRGGYDIMIIYVPNDCESNSENVVVKDFN